MDPASPFRRMAQGPPRERPAQGVVHVNFCDICHYVWKAPAAAEWCVNCRQDRPTARSLVSYRTEAPIT